MVKTEHCFTLYFLRYVPRVMWKTLRERQVMEIQGLLGEMARPLKCRGS